MAPLIVVILGELTARDQSKGVVIVWLGERLVLDVCILAMWEAVGRSRNGEADDEDA